MALFPVISSLRVQDPLKETLQYKTIRTTFGEMGMERRKIGWVYPKRSVVISCKDISLTEARTLYNFIVARSGSYDAFNFKFPMSATYTGEYVGTGDATTTVWNLPSFSGSSYKIYIDGIEQTDAVNYTFGAAGGEDGADKVTFTTAPALGQRITYDFTGYLKIRGTMQEDTISFETMCQKLVTTGLTIKGDLNA